jgi:hypothetical protein
MRTTKVDCTIERRLLLNYRVGPELIAPHLPVGFRPQAISGWAVGGVCLIRLAHTRPTGFPGWIGLGSENVAHRFAVEWDDGGGPQVGVYIPRRDTNSRVVAVAGGPIFPGFHHRSRFSVMERSDEIHISVDSFDREVHLYVDARPADRLDSQLFDSVEDAMEFFKQGSVGWSPSSAGILDQVRLVSDRWTAKPVTVSRVASSLFDDPNLFPPDRCHFDSALLMKNLRATWIGRPSVPESPRGHAFTSRHITTNRPHGRRGVEREGARFLQERRSGLEGES